MQSSNNNVICWQNMFGKDPTLCLVAVLSTGGQQWNNGVK